MLDPLSGGLADGESLGLLLRLRRRLSGRNDPQRSHIMGSVSQFD